MGRSIDVEDPLTLAIAPPPNESPAEREARERLEAEEKRVNDEIDEMLRQERINRRRRKPVKVLLLGQSESGKSTTLKSMYHLSLLFTLFHVLVAHRWLRFPTHLCSKGLARRA